jgi:adenylate kinase family enzyme
MEDLQAIVATASVDDKDKEVTTARRNLVTDWVAKINNAKGVHKKAFEQMKADMDLAFYGYDPKLWSEDKYVVNLAQRHVQQRTAALYAKNPRAVAKPRRRLMNTIWDGKPETIQQAKAVEQMAMQAMEPVPQAVAMVLAEYNQITEMRKRMERVGETLEILFHYYMQDAQPSFKSQMKALVRRMLTTGVGYVKLGFQRETERRPEVSARMNDIKVQLDHLERLAKETADGEISDTDAASEELRLAFEELTKQPDMIVREGLMFDFPDSTAIIIDPRCKQLRGFIGARWIAHEMFFTTEEVSEIYGVDVKGNYTPYDVQGRSHDSSRKSLSSNSISKEHVEDGMVCVYEIYDKPSGLVYVVAEGHKDFLKDPAAPDLQIETFWPVFSLVCNEVEHQKEIYPPSDVHLMRSMVSEYNRAREGLREHRKANRPTYLTPAGVLEDEDKEKLATRPAHSVLSLQGMQAGQKSEDLVTPLKTIGIDPNLYEVGTGFDDVQLAVGAQEAQFGTTGGATATENSIAESSRMSALGAQVDELDSFMSEVTRCAGAILLQQMSAEQVKAIAGPGAVWPELTAQEIADEVVLEIEAGSTGKPNQAAELRNLERVLPFVIQIPGIDPKWLAKEVLKRMDDKLDVDAALADGMGSIVSMNGMSDPNAAAGMGQGPAGGMNAPQMGAPGVGPTGPTQMLG